MKKLLVVLILILAIGAGAAFLLTKNATQQTASTLPEQPIDASPTGTQTVPSTSINISSMGVGLVEQNSSGQFGGVELVEVDGKTKVTITVDPGIATDPQPAHIHLGSCPTPGAVKFPLTNVVGGKSETIINTTLGELVADLPLAINIHKSTAEVSTYYSCGDLIAPQE